LVQVVVGKLGRIDLLEIVGLIEWWEDVVVGGGGGVVGAVMER
jgi:hypothetical protein